MLQVVQPAGAPAIEISDAEGERDQRASAPPPILVQYLQTVVRWKWVILGILVAALAAGIVITLLTTPVYTATARLEISREQQNVTSVQGLESPQATRDDEFYQTQYSLLAARTLAERVARALNLAGNDAFFAAHGVNPAGSLPAAGPNHNILTPAERQRRESLATGLLLAHVRINPILRSSLVDVQYTSASPSISADIANAWVQQFIAASQDRRFSSTADARRFLEGRLAELGQRLEASERAVVQYSAQKHIVTLGRVVGPDGRTEADRTLVSSDLQAINAALAQATADRIAAESRLRAQGASPEALSNVALNGLRQRRAEVASERARMLVQFEPDYPPARALAEQVRTLDASIAREESRIASGRSRDYEQAVARENSLRQQQEALTRTLTQQRQDSIQYNIYQREADTNRQLYDSLLQRYKEIGVAGVSPSNIVIVDPAKVPSTPSAPKLVINLALALMAGLGIAFLSVLGLEQIDEGLRDPSTVGTLLQLPLLGVIPDLGSGMPLDALADSKSELSEAYLSVRSSLAFSTEHGFPRSLMMTSSKPAEGKSTSALGLAIVLSRTGKRVVLLDADMRAPSVHHYFDKPNTVGLSNYLAGNDHWQSMVLPSGVDRLGILPAGPQPPNAAELLSGDRMPQLMRRLEEEYDHIIVDSPPILGLADAPLLSRSVEGCAFVVEAESAPVRGLRSALARLHQAQSRIYGVIVTRLKQRRAGYGYGYGYGYGKSEQS